MLLIDKELHNYLVLFCVLVTFIHLFIQDVENNSARTNKEQIKNVK